VTLPGSGGEAKGLAACGKRRAERGWGKRATPFGSALREAAAEGRLRRGRGDAGRCDCVEAVGSPPQPPSLWPGRRFPISIVARKFAGAEPHPSPLAP